MEIVKVKQLTKYYGKRCVVDHIDFSVNKKECLGVLGPNGAGKTTTLKMMLGQTQPTSGELNVLGYPLPKDGAKMRARVGVVPQLDNLDPDFSVIENMFTYASYFGLKRKNIENRVKELLKFVSLDAYATENVMTLSGGMRRRLTLARALINNPELIILDEPTTGLDPQGRQLLWARLRELKSTGATFILTTHYMEEAERLCDRVLIIDYGRILAHGTPVELIQKWIEPHVFEIHHSNGLSFDDLQKSLPLERFELVGETLWCYSNEEKRVLNMLEKFPGCEFLLRRANLEDVFLKLTARDLRDEL